jgi:hypothetical protein
MRQNAAYRAGLVAAMFLERTRDTLVLGCGDPPRNCPNIAVDGGPCPSYQNDVVPVIMHKCYECHGPGGIEQSTHDYTRYSVIFQQKGTIFGQLFACLMPPTNAMNGDLTMTEKQTVLFWIACGAPQN